MKSEEAVLERLEDLQNDPHIKQPLTKPDIYLYRSKWEKLGQIEALKWVLTNTPN